MANEKNTNTNTNANTSANTSANVPHEYKTTKTMDEICHDLREGKSVKAIDMCSAMGIKVIQF